MKILSDFTQDKRHIKKKPGSYEWWYFDAISNDGEYSIVVIFYEGIPFSSRYIDAINDESGYKAYAESHPAISISIYRKGKPFFYSLSEYPPEDCLISDTDIDIKIGSNQLFATRKDSKLHYKLLLNESLPGGDSLKGTLVMNSDAADTDIFQHLSTNQQKNQVHDWNLVQPKTSVHGNLHVTSGKTKEVTDVPFEGIGYHDHNTGSEPMKQKFKDWYWGRFHFDAGTLVYYVMNTVERSEYKAWLISPDNEEILHNIAHIKASDIKWNKFMLRVSRRLDFKSTGIEAHVRQKEVLDSGPFYMRFLSEATLKLPQTGTQKVTGLSEYIHPSRIHQKWFRPLVNMRYRYVDDAKAHWVQRSPRMYRWTW